MEEITQKVHKVSKQIKKSYGRSSSLSSRPLQWKLNFRHEFEIENTSLNQTTGYRIPHWSKKEVNLRQRMDMEEPGNRLVQ
uniref:Ovule protein n=1 Tax=Romanomermis culicivorax TaxID=13658 RepID=A0A915IY75_ROMCU